jgi:hypothetical protein
MRVRATNTEKKFLFLRSQTNLHNTFNTYPIWKISRSFELPSPCAHFAVFPTAPNHCHTPCHYQMTLSLFCHCFSSLFIFSKIYLFTKTFTTLPITIHTRSFYAHSLPCLRALILPPKPLHLPTATLYPTIKCHCHCFFITLFFFFSTFPFKPSQLF